MGTKLLELKSRLNTLENVLSENKDKLAKLKMCISRLAGKPREPANA
jgi:hypothetical protein